MTIESHIGTVELMTTQIAVRLPDHLVAFLDARVAGGEKSRAAVVTKALMTYERQLSGERDAEIYRQQGDGLGPDWDEWIRNRSYPPVD